MGQWVVLVVVLAVLASLAWPTVQSMIRRFDARDPYGQRVWKRQL
jgi:Tfp pilus assembly protein PilE